MNTFPAFWTALRGVITGAWPEVFGPEHPIFRATQANRKPWRKPLQEGRLQSPWVIVQVPPTRQEGGWGAANVVYRPRVTVFYVTENQTPDVAAFVEAKLADLEARLVAGDYTGFQCMYDFAYDVTDDNPANTAFTSGNLPLFGGSLEFVAQFGYIAGT